MTRQQAIEKYGRADVAFAIRNGVRHWEIERRVYIDSEQMRLFMARYKRCCGIRHDRSFYTRCPKCGESFRKQPRRKTACCS